MTGEESQKPIAAKAHLAMSLTTSSPTISLSNDPSISSLQLNVTTRIITSTSPTSAITLSTDKSVLDNGNHERQDGLFWGVMLPLRSTTHPDRSTSLKFAGTSNYGSYDASINLRERPWERFETIPLIGRGSLSIKHDLTLERLFRYSRNVKATDIRLGEKFHIKMNPRLLFWAGWWTSGDLDDAAGLGKKRFAKWERPDEDGTISNLMPGEQRPDVEQMEREGWVFSEIG